MQMMDRIFAFFSRDGRHVERSGNRQVGR